MEPITSEQELKTLLEEGKVTQEEYQQLLSAMRDKPRHSAEALPDDLKVKSRTKLGLGKAALFLFLFSVSLPLAFVLIYIIAGTKRADINAVSVFLSPVGIFLGVCGLLTVVLGFTAWKTSAGKIAVVGVLFLVVVCFFLIFLPMFLFQASAIQSKKGNAVATIYKIYSCDSLDGLLTKSGVELDKTISSDGNGSVRIQSGQGKTTVRLFETGPVDTCNSVLWYQAKLRCENITGRTYLEMWYVIPGKGEFFSKGFDNTISGTTDWVSMQIPFRNDTPVKPDNVKLNLVIEGAGTVWIDDIRLTGQSFSIGAVRNVG
jgi:hypothetical protein